MPFLTRFFLLIIFLSALTGKMFPQKAHENVLTKKYPPQQLKEDATIIKNVILKMHPGIGIYRSRNFYEGLFSAFINSLNDSLTEKQFRIRVKILLEEVKCGHTEAVSSREYIRASDKVKLGFSPYVFIPVNNRVFVLAAVNRKKDTLMKRGVEITKINGVSTDTMLIVCKKLITTDGFNESGKNHYLKLGFNSYYPAVFQRPDTFTVEFKKGDSLRSVRYPAIKVNSVPPISLAPRDDSAFILHKRAAIKYRFLDSAKSSMHLKIHAFSRRKFKKVYRRVFRKMERNKTENLVLDLRYNGGGSLENSYRLLSYLLDTAETQTLKTGIKSYPYRQYAKGEIWFKLMKVGFSLIAKKKSVNDTDHFIYTIKPRKKNHFNGKIYVLINGGSFSASVLVATYLRQTGRAVFIGEETSGATEGCNAGITPYYKMPNTKIRIRVPAFRVQHDVSPAITGHGIIPDYPVTYFIDDILKRKDLELERAKALINKAQ